MQTASARTLLALQTLGQHGLPSQAAHIVFQAVVMATINYDLRALWGFTDDLGRLEAFYCR